MTSVYLMKDNGILIASVSDANTSDTSRRDLESSLLTGIGIGISTTFLESIDHIVLVDKTVVYYRSFKFDEYYCVLIVANKQKDGMTKDLNISAKMVEMKMFLQEKARWRVLTTCRDGLEVHHEISRKLSSVFLS